VPDVFDAQPYEGFIDDFFAVILACEVFENFDHAFLLSTGHPDRLRAYFDSRSPADHLRAWAKAAGGGWIVCDNEDVCFHEVVEGTTSGRWNADRTLVSGTLAEPYTHVGELWPLPNLLLGLRCTDQASLDAALPHLFAAPARRYWLDLDGLRGPVDLTRVQFNRHTNYDVLEGCGHSDRSPCQSSPNVHGERLSWVRVRGGGEPLHPDWLRSIRDQCAAAGVPWRFEGWGEWCPGVGNFDETVYLENGGRWRPGWDHDWDDQSKAKLWSTHPCGVPGMEDCHSAIVSVRVGACRSGRTLEGRPHDDLPAREAR
jgi:hypothetical protein